MNLDNKYFAVVEPVFYLERIGNSLSNTWIGASRAFDTIFVGDNAQMGDEFHLLVGGDFIRKANGDVRAVTFWHPKPLLEKTYGPMPNSQHLMKELENLGRVMTVDAPRGKVDYAGARDLPKFPEGHPRLTYQSHSETFYHMQNSTDLVRDMAEDRGLSVQFYDFHQDRQVLMQVTKTTDMVRSLVFEARGTERNELHVSPSETWFDRPAFVDALRDGDGVKKGYVYKGRSFWATGIDYLEDDGFLEQLQIGMDRASEADAAPKPRP